MPNFINGKPIIIKSLTDFKIRVIENMRANDAYVTGNTANSMRIDAGDDYGIVWGREDFENIETGVSPEMAKKKSESTLAHLIYWWTFARGMNFKNEARRESFSRVISSNLQSFGSLLYKHGGRKNIYSNEVEQTVKEISDGIAKSIIEVKLIDNENV